jgi:hypothetical protein
MDNNRLPKRRSFPLRDKQRYFTNSTSFKSGSTGVARPTMLTETLTRFLGSGLHFALGFQVRDASAPLIG